jgi:hypothetical protein
MKNRIAVICLIATGLAASAQRVVAAEAQTNAVPARLSREQWQKLTPEEQEARRKALRAQRESTAGQPAPSLREQLRDLPPAEREAKLKELRAQQGLPPLDPEMQKLRDELMQMSPEERQAKLAEMRKNRPAPPPVDEKVREQRRAALLKKLSEMRALKAEGKLSPEDEKRLEQLERVEKLMQTQPAPGKPAEQTTAKPAPPADKSN